LAVELAKFRGESISLKCLKVISDTTAAALASYRGKLFLGRHNSVPKGLERHFMSRDRDQRELNKLTTLSQEVAHGIAHLSDALVLELNGLSSLSEDAASELATHRGLAISLKGLKTIADEVAAALSSYRGRLLFNKKALQLSDYAAKRLKRHIKIVFNPFTGELE
jgi:hypothetical protein